MKTRVTALGHSVHPMLVAFPIGLLTTATIFDFIDLVGGSNTFGVAAFYTMAAGLIGAAASATTGLIDWTGIPRGTRAKSIGVVHAILNATVTVVFLVAWLARLGRPEHRTTVGLLVLQIVALGALGIAAWFGGELIARLGIGVHGLAHPDASSSLAKTERAGVAPSRLPDGVLMRELNELHRTRTETIRYGSDQALSHHSERQVALEQEYLRRHPDREVSMQRLRVGARQRSNENPSGDSSTS